MTVDELKGAICKYFNDSEEFPSPFVKSPTNASAPVGTYIAVGVDSVEQYGSRMSTPPGTHLERFSQVATLHLVEVEGDGDLLRKVRNELQRPAFVTYARRNGFTVWEQSPIERIDTYDGEFYVRQWRFTASFNFIDGIETETPRIETVSPVELQTT